MKATIITIGDEILIGQTLDTNSGWIGSFLENNGIHVHQTISVSDSLSQIVNTISDSFKSVDLILMTGGLGPTKDDITKQSLCDYFNDELVFHKAIHEEIKSYFVQRQRIVNSYTKLQAYLPSSCEVLHNRKGTAPGMWFDKEGKMLASMPGIPHEMKDMMPSVLQKIKAKHDLIEIVHKTVYTRGIIESHLAELISDWENNLPKEIKLAYLPSVSSLMLRFTARGHDRSYLEHLIEQNITSLKSIIGHYYSPIQKRLAEEVVGELLKINNQTISFAESCTGGNLSKMITSVSGSSSYFKGSLVAYHTNIKTEVLGVKTNVINDYGVVSEEVVKEMATSCKALFKSDYAIATSGLASSDDVDGVKGGTICLAVATPDKVVSEKILFTTSRQINIERASNKALNLLIQLLS